MNYTFTLAFNLFSEVEKTVESLYSLNDKKDFSHLLVDVGFPVDDNTIPKDFEEIRQWNTFRLKTLAARLGSEYLQIPNIGVSQNWQQVANYLNVGEGDVLLCSDCDERPQSKDWVKAIGDVMNAEPKLGWVSLMLPEHFKGARKIANERMIAGQTVWEIKGHLNWAQGGMSGKLIKEMGGIPYPKDWEIYGGLEGETIKRMDELGYTWAMLPEHLCVHDLQQGTLLRAWKNYLCFEKPAGIPQPTFEEYLNSIRV